MLLSDSADHYTKVWLGCTAMLSFVWVLDGFLLNDFSYGLKLYIPPSHSKWQRVSLPLTLTTPHCPALPSLPHAEMSMVGHGAGGAAAPKAAAAVEEGEAVPQPMLGKPFVEVQWEMLHHNPSILYFRALLLQIQVCSAPCLRHPSSSLYAALLSAAL